MDHFQQQEYIETVNTRYWKRLEITRDNRNNRLKATFQKYNYVST